MMGQNLMQYTTDKVTHMVLHGDISIIRLYQRRNGYFCSLGGYIFDEAKFFNLIYSGVDWLQ